MNIMSINAESIIMIFTTILTAIFLLITLISFYQKTSKKTNETHQIYKLIRVNEENEKNKYIANAISNMPDGITEKEYFSKLKAVLSEVSYDQIKNNGKSSTQSSVEDLIRSHHEQALTQATIQFWTSLIASIIGFVFIIIMIFIAKDSLWYEYILKTLPGIIIEAVSYLFFKQSSEIRNRASDFLNRLRNDEQISKSITIADSIEDENLKSQIKAKIALHICGITQFENKEESQKQ